MQPRSSDEPPASAVATAPAGGSRLYRPAAYNHPEDSLPVLRVSNRMPSVSIQPADPASADAVALLQQLDAYLLSLYPPESNHLLSIEALRQPNVVFLTAVVDGRVAGCGAMVNQDGEYAEIKRVFVLPQ